MPTQFCIVLKRYMYIIDTILKSSVTKKAQNYTRLILLQILGWINNSNQLLILITQPTLLTVHIFNTIG